MNSWIRAKNLRVIDDSGENLGVLETSEALKIAQEKELDLVLIAPNSEPPVAKITDYNKFLYEENKKQQSARAKSKKSEIKEVWMTPTTGMGDIKRFTNRAREWFKEGNKVKAGVKMRGRQLAFPEVALERLKELQNEMSEFAVMEGEPKRVGPTIWVIFNEK